MTKDVLVSVKGTQYMDGESDTVEVITAGTCHEKNGKWYVMYEETTEGVKEVTRNTVKIHPEKEKNKKKGLIEALLTYEPGKQYMTHYKTPMGLFVMGTTTSALNVQISDKELLAEIDYNLEMNGQHISRCHLEMKVTSKG